MIGARILVDKLAFHLTGIHRGDIVVFRRPPGEPVHVADLVKRVIGLPGETISPAPDGAVLIDGRPIGQPWLSASARGNPGGPITTTRIPAGHYFVMGDDRGNSSDSRVFGPISRSLIVGRADARIWPLGHAGGL